MATFAANDPEGLIVRWDSGIRLPQGNIPATPQDKSHSLYCAFSSQRDSGVGTVRMKAANSLSFLYLNANLSSEGAIIGRLPERTRVQLDAHAAAPE
jgi:hypothetical protein